MQDPGNDIKEVVRILLAGTATERQKVIDKCFTPQAEFVHPLLTLRGRREIFDLYQYWYEINLKIRFHLPKIVVSQQKDRLVLDFDEFVTPFALPWGSVLIRLVVFLDLQKTPKGYRISRQEDHLLIAESLLKNLPLVDRLWEGCGRRLVGLSILYTMRVLGKVVSITSKSVFPYIPMLDRIKCLQARLKDINQVMDNKLLQKWDAEEVHQPINT